jgi:hypothetical protein
MCSKYMECKVLRKGRRGFKEILRCQQTNEHKVNLQSVVQHSIINYIGMTLILLHHQMILHAIICY